MNIKKSIKSFIIERNKKKEYKDINILTAQMGNEEIKKLVNKNKPLMISRIGSVELEVVSAFLYKNKIYTSKIMDKAYTNAGIFPRTSEMMDRFSNVFLEGINYADYMGVWFNKNEGKLVCAVENIKVGELGSIEPYYFENPWSAILKGKKVLVIHPLTETIQNQYKKREFLFSNLDILPEFELITIKPVQSAAGEETDFEDWEKALIFMKKQIDSVEFDIALIGAGAYGLPLASHIKKRGKIGIHVGGALQILFGIKGKRWDEHPVIKNLYNEYWVYPEKKDRPKNYKKIENGCYW